MNEWMNECLKIISSCILVPAGNVAGTLGLQIVMTFRTETSCTIRLKTELAVGWTHVCLSASRQSQTVKYDRALVMGQRGKGSRTESRHRGWDDRSLGVENVPEYKWAWGDWQCTQDRRARRPAGTDWCPITQAGRRGSGRRGAICFVCQRRRRRGIACHQDDGRAPSPSVA